MAGGEGPRRLSAEKVASICRDAAWRALDSPILTGDQASPHTILALVMSGPPSPIHELAPGVPPELEAICEKAMARQAGERYADMGELAEDLRAYVENRVVQAHRTGALVELTKWVQRNKALAATIAALVCLTVGGSTTAALVLRGENAAIRVARDAAHSCSVDVLVDQDRVAIRVDHHQARGTLARLVRLAHQLEARLLQ